MIVNLINKYSFFGADFLLYKICEVIMVTLFAGPVIANTGPGGRVMAITRPAKKKKYFQKCVESIFCDLMTRIMKNSGNLGDFFRTLFILYCGI